MDARAPRRPQSDTRAANARITRRGPGRGARLHDLAARVRRAGRVPTTEAGLTIAGGTAPADRGPMGGEGVVRAEGAATHAGASVLEAALTVWAFGPDHSPREVALTDAPGLVAGDESVVWVDLSGYSAADLHEVAGLLDLPHQAVRATLGPWHRPRLVVYADHLFVSATVPRLDPGAYQVQAGELDLVVGRNLVVSAHKASLPFGTHLRDRLLVSSEGVQRDAPLLLYSVLDELLSYYEELHRHLQVEIERLEERALHDASDRFLADLVRFKRYAFALSQLADQHRDVVTAFLRPDFPWVAGTEAAESFEDLQQRLTRLIDLLLAAKDAVNGAFEIHVSHML